MNDQLNLKQVFLFTLFLCLIGGELLGNVNLPAYFSDHMVLQQKSEVRIWGWAKPREKVEVKVSWSDAVLSTEADNQAHWEVWVETPAAGGPYDISIKGYNEINIRDVWMGEVWLCSGQSNMEWPMSGGVIGAEAAIAKADHPRIRMFTVAHRTALAPQIDLEGAWEVCTPETVGHFSAVAYFFAQKLQKELGVPVGLIHSSWGGTPAETWISEEVIAGDKKLTTAATILEPVPWGPVEPARAYNAMIAPLRSYKIAGVLWYQGEANTVNAEYYTDMFGTLINSWRADWGYDFPFYYVQIAPYRYGKGNRGTMVRDAQRRVISIPNTGMVVTSDIGDTTDIHPRNKLDVGVRLANLALSEHYDVMDAATSGPLFKSMEIDGKKIVVSFDNAEGLHARDGALQLFEIAGRDWKFYPAKAFIKKGKVVVLSKKVGHPVAVRFAWGNTATPNLFNSAGLPASSFISE
ncbi:MAG: sialate O-acetylesterase [Saprospiraceae bacterium]|nr:sialate O-acetylesterase [Lewinella sp.]